MISSPSKRNSFWGSCFFLKQRSHSFSAEK